MDMHPLVVSQGNTHHGAYDTKATFPSFTLHPSAPMEPAKICVYYVDIQEHETADKMGRIRWWPLYYSAQDDDDGLALIRCHELLMTRTRHRHMQHNGSIMNVDMDTMKEVVYTASEMCDYSTVGCVNTLYRGLRGHTYIYTQDEDGPVPITRGLLQTQERAVYDNNYDIHVCGTLRRIKRPFEGGHQTMYIVYLCGEKCGVLAVRERCDDTDFCTRSHEKKSSVVPVLKEILEAHSRFRQIGLC